MKEDKKFLIEKDILIDGGKSSIKKGSMLYRTHGVYYLDGGMLPMDYQEDFDNLVEYEYENGWYYLSPITTVVAFRNKKENN